MFVIFSKHRTAKQKSKSYISMDPHFFLQLDHPKLPVFFKPTGDGHIAVKFANAGRPGPSGTPDGDDTTIAAQNLRWRESDGWMEKVF